jgi:hypothetical protein
MLKARTATDQELRAISPLRLSRSSDMATPPAAASSKQLQRNAKEANENEKDEQRTDENRRRVARRLDLEVTIALPVRPSTHAIS